MENPLIASVATGETQRQKKRKRDTTGRKKENVEVNKQTTCLLFNISQLITV